MVNVREWGQSILFCQDSHHAQDIEPLVLLACPLRSRRVPFVANRLGQPTPRYTSRSVASAAIAAGGASFTRRPLSRM